MLQQKTIVLFTDAFVLVVVLGLACGTLVMGNALSKFSWSEMDWLDRGHTTLSDVYTAIERDKRTFVQGDKVCTDYYSIRDGMTVKTVCREDSPL